MPDCAARKHGNGAKPNPTTTALAMAAVLLPRSTVLAPSALQVSKFEPKVFFETGNIVMVLVDEDITVTATGIRIYEEDQVHIWHFDDRGYVVRYRQRVDTHLHWSAYHGRST